MRNSEKLLQIPMLEKVAEDIYKLSVHFPFGMRQVNCYLFKGDNGFTVVDTGSCAKESIAIWEQVMDAGIKVEKLIFTHTHPDHIGLAGWFQKTYGTPVHMSGLCYKEVQRVRNLKSGQWMCHFFKQHGGPEISEDLLMSESKSYDFEPDVIFENNEKIKLGNDSYEVIRTPGHAPDHICFYQPERQILVAGDHVLDEISPIIAVWSADDLNPLQDYFDSLDLVSGLKVKLVLPGHGGLIEDLPARAAAIKSGHIRRMQQIFESIKDEAKPAGQIYQDIYGELSIYKFFAPLMTTISRLIYLESIGKVQSKIKNGEYYYYLID
ncbi:MBL fold metallo-hydrolase [Bacillus benzoevorans]|uniref:Glyoxylase-like metal-dependent hydrolase (Beta-lactamase superfamily II) n=1 Tax=Bacillus benzoevorans TaxID=1456 RepID=A0A7X0HXY4_9BACI|nr:MBL fold metallo-hydrolase [Bacillus benzoevorans]MBB6447650.1 glyoxylase-like metal-dependent hydrolase (beta-lactamase superfamily II) [Bacillus benzoevorans]